MPLVRILQTRRAKLKQAGGQDEALRRRWRWSAGGVILVLLAATSVDPAPLLAAVLGMGSVGCFVANRLVSPGTRAKIRIHKSRNAGRHGVLRRSQTRNCAACLTPLASDPTISCSKYAAHVIHRRCKDLMRGKCPRCGSPLR